MLFFMVGLYSCKEDESNTSQPKVPVISTNQVSEISETSAKCGGNIISDNGSPITVSGLCWNTSNNPSVDDFKTTDGSISGAFESIMLGLESGEKYYVRAYATNKNGTGYGSIVSFTTEEAALIPVTDIDGNLYELVKIGNQIWFASNLKTTRFKNGDIIPTTSPHNIDISSENEPKYQWSYNGDENYVSDYGLLYTWYCINDPRGICPEGWHISTKAEWDELSDFLGYWGVGGKMKETGTEHWKLPNVGATNESGFNGLPGGNRSQYGGFSYINEIGAWWTASEKDANTAYDRLLNYMDEELHNGQSSKKTGRSLRCIKD